MGNLQDGHIVWGDLVYTNDRAEFERYRLRRGDLLFNRTNTIDLVGKTSLFDAEREALYAGYLIRIAVDSTKVDSRYLNYILNTPVAKRHSLKVLSVAVGQANINGQKLRTYPIPLPPTKSEQEAIAEALQDADALIEALISLIEKKQHIRNGVAHELLTGARRLPGFHEDWVTTEIGNVAVASSEKNSGGEQLPVLTCSKHLGFVDSLRFFKNQVYSSDLSGYKLIRRGQIGYPANHVEEGSIGLQDIYDTALVSPIYVVFSVRADHSSYFLHRLLKLEHYRHQFETATSASIDRRGSLRWPSFSRIKIRMPNRLEQLAVGEVLRAAETEIAVLEAKLDKARQIKQGMMHNLLTGCIRLPASDANEELKPTPASASPQSHNWQINEAVVISMLTKMFGSEQYPLGRKRYTKLSYLLHRRAERRVEGYLKKAAGPYNPATKYGGPEKIALDNKYVRRHKRGNYEGFVESEAIGKAQEYFNKWYGADAAQWLGQFRYASNDDLELWATVDMAMVELRSAGREVTVDAVKGILRSHPNWLPKLDRDLFADKGIADAIAKCDQLFGDHGGTAS
jgi:type I restriction enzyme S subunit